MNPSCSRADIISFVQWQPFEYTSIFRGREVEKLKRGKRDLNLALPSATCVSFKKTYQVHPAKRHHCFFIVCVIIAALWMALKRNTNIIWNPIRIPISSPIPSCRGPRSFLTQIFSYPSIFLLSSSWS